MHGGPSPCVLLTMELARVDGENIRRQQALANADRKIASLTARSDLQLKRQRALVEEAQKARADAEFWKARHLQLSLRMEDSRWYRISQYFTGLRMRFGF